jgi:hypothetical protein
MIIGMCLHFKGKTIKDPNTHIKYSFWYVDNLENAKCKSLLSSIIHINFCIAVVLIHVLNYRR